MYRNLFRFYAQNSRCVWTNKNLTFCFFMSKKYSQSSLSLPFYSWFHLLPRSSSNEVFLLHLTPCHFSLRIALIALPPCAHDRVSCINCPIAPSHLPRCLRPCRIQLCLAHMVYKLSLRYRAPTQYNTLGKPCAHVRLPEGPARVLLTG